MSNRIAREYPDEAWIDDIRIQLYEETKHMTAEERLLYFKGLAREAIEAHGIIVKTVPSTPVRIKP